MIVYDPTVSERYAQALFNVAKREGRLMSLLEESGELLKMFEAKTRLRSFIEGPQISTEAKQDLMDRTMKGKIDKLFFQLLSLLLAKGRIEYVSQILERFHKLVERDQGIFEGTVATAKPLGDQERQKLQPALEKFVKGKLRINYLVDPSLIGGVRFSSGDTLVDDSVKGKLEKLRHKLQEAIAV